jgi:capsular polysaccharide transport system permease protein
MPLGALVNLPAAYASHSSSFPGPAVLGGCAATTSGAASAEPEANAFGAIPFGRMPASLSPLSTASQAPRRTPWQVQCSVIFAIVLREMRARVGGQWIGAIWTLFEPLAHVGMMMAWISLIRGPSAAAIEYPVFLATGLIPFFFFQKLVTRLLDGIEANRSLFSYRQVKPIDGLVGRAIVESMMNMIVYLVTLLILAWLGFHVIPAMPLEMIGVNLMIMMFGFAFGLLTAVLCHGRERLRSVIRMTFFPLYLASGVIFSVDTLPREYLEWLLLNPLLHLIELSRHSFIPAYRPVDGINAWYPAGWILVCGAWGLSLYWVNRFRLLTVR